MSAPITSSRKLFTQCFCNILKSNRISYRKYAVTKKIVQEVLNHDIKVGENYLAVEGWVKAIKKQRLNTFFHINDGTSREHLQVVSPPELCSNDLSYGCSVRVEGDLVESPAKGQAVELVARNVQLIGNCDNQTYPVQYKEKQNLRVARRQLHLRPRREHHYKLLQIRNTASMAVHHFFQKHDFMFIHTPIITSSNCEGAVEMFNLQTNVKLDDTDSDQETEDIEKLENLTEEQAKLFFHRPVFMTVSGQLHLETMTGCTRKVYNFGPTFRAEPSKTMHHLAEFYMIEAELGFTENLESILKVMENLVKDVTNDVLTKHPEEYEFFKKQAPEGHDQIVNNLTNTDYVRISYTDAVQMLQKNNKEYSETLKWGDDLSKQHEKYLVNILGNVPVFITDFPKDMKPFYCRINNDNQTVSAVDLLVPGVGELFGGSLREERYDVLKTSLNKLQFTDDYEWYLDLRRYGSVPHGGFGMGFERYLQCLLGIQNIKDTIPFPRWPHHCLL